MVKGNNSSMAEGVAREARHVAGFLESLRRTARGCYQLRSYKNALHWADQCVTFSGGNSDDVFFKAQCLYQLGHYRLASHLILNSESEDSNGSAAWTGCSNEALLLAAQALHATSSFDEALDILFHLEERFPEVIEHSIAEQNKSFAQAMLGDVSMSSTSSLNITPRLASYYMSPRGTRATIVQPVAEPVEEEAPPAKWKEGKTPNPRIAQLQRQAVTPPLWQSFASGGSTPMGATKEGSLALVTSTPELPAAFDSVLPSSDSLFISNVHLLKAKCFDALDDMVAAATSYKLALSFDLGCVEALEELSKWKRLTQAQEKEVLDMVVTAGDRNQRGGENREYRQALLALMYEAKFGLPTHKGSDRMASIRVRFKDKLLGDSNPAAMIHEATRLFNHCEPQEALTVTRRVLEKEPYNLDVLPVHIASLVETNKHIDLFALGHQLIEAFPEEPIAWFAAACYNFLVRKHDQCRRLVQKIIRMRSSFGFAWLLYGHSFAAEKEHDQANAAYFKCWQYMQGSHLPLVYIAVEYTCTNNVLLAQGFFQQAARLAPDDPFLLHEMAVVAYNQGEYRKAEEYFSKAYERVRSITPSPAVLPKIWEPLLNNHGHCYRKLNRLVEAKRKHYEALLLVGPVNPVTFKALALVCALENDGVGAFRYLSKAQSLKARDLFCEDLSKRLLEFQAKQAEFGVGMFSLETENPGQTVDPSSDPEEPSMSDVASVV